MADQVSTFGLDDGPFVRGLNKLEAESARGAARIDSQWGRANKGVAEMAESVHGMSRIMRTIIAPVHLLAWAERGVAGLEALYNAGQKFREELDKISASAARITEGVVSGARQGEGFKSEIALARDYQGEIAKIRQEVQKARESRSGLGEDLGVYKLFGSGSIEDLRREADKRIAVIENEQRQAQRILHRDNRAKATGKADEEIKKQYDAMVRENEERYQGQQKLDEENAARAKGHGDEVNRLEVEDQRARIGLLRAAGLEKESEELRVQLELAEKLREIAASKNLSDDEKRSFAGRARQAAELAIGIIKDRPEDPERRVSSGTVGAGVGSGTLGQAFLVRGVDHQKKTAENSSAIVQLLKDVAMLVRGMGGGAVVQ